MRISSLVIVLVAIAAPVTAQDVVFYDGFESGDTTGWWAPARVGKTGQTTCYDEAGAVIACAGTGQDGDLQPGVGWPNPRFVDNTDGTVTDMLTGLVWLKNANCATGTMTWQAGLGFANSLYDGSVAHNGGDCGLTDGSEVGDWRLPSANELQSLVDYEYDYPALSNAAGTGQWTEGDVFAGVQSHIYWSSTSRKTFPSWAWCVYLHYGAIFDNLKTDTNYIWPVRNGQ